jgi:hypothetical protein
MPASLTAELTLNWCRCPDIRFDQPSFVVDADHQASGNAFGAEHVRTFAPRYPTEAVGLRSCSCNTGSQAQSRFGAPEDG